MGPLNGKTHSHLDLKAISAAVSWTLVIELIFNYETKDDWRNFLPIGIIFCGAEPHNNHHTNPATAKQSMRCWEVDAGWLVIRTLALLRLVKINRVAAPNFSASVEPARTRGLRGADR